MSFTQDIEKLVETAIMHLEEETGIPSKPVEK